MASYGSDAEVQKLAFGAVDTNQNTRSTSARDVATSIINTELNLKTDLTTPGNEINRCCNLISAGIILSGQITVDSNQMHPFYKQGLDLLAKLRGDKITWGSVIPVNRFDGRISSSDTIHSDSLN